MAQQHKTDKDGGKERKAKKLKGVGYERTKKHWREEGKKVKGREKRNERRKWED